MRKIGSSSAIRTSTEGKRTPTVFIRHPRGDGTIVNTNGFPLANSAPTAAGGEPSSRQGTGLARRKTKKAGLIRGESGPALLQEPFSYRGASMRSKAQVKG